MTHRFPSTTQRILRPGIVAHEASVVAALDRTASRSRPLFSRLRAAPWLAGLCGAFLALGLLAGQELGTQRAHAPRARSSASRREPRAVTLAAARFEPALRTKASLPPAPPTRRAAPRARPARVPLSDALFADFEPSFTVVR